MFWQPTTISTKCNPFNDTLSGFSFKRYPISINSPQLLINFAKRCNGGGGVIFWAALSDKFIHVLVQSKLESYQNRFNTGEIYTPTLVQKLSWKRKAQHSEEKYS